MRGEFKFALFLVLFLLLVAFLYFNVYKTEEMKEFEVNTLFLKFSMVEGTDISRNIDITNTAGKEKIFFAELNNFNNIISLNKQSFSIQNNEKESIMLNLNAKNYPPGIYLEMLVIKTDSYNVKIPIVVEVQSKEVYFDSNIEMFTKGDRIFQGGRISSEIKIFDLSNLGRKNLVMDYFIKDFQNNEIIHESESLVVDRNLDISKNFEISSNVEPGDYVLGVVLKYGDSVGTSSLFFKISEKETIKEFIIDNLNFLILIVVFFVSLLLLLIFWIIYRGSVIGELMKMHHSELRREREIMNLKRDEAFKKLKTKIERKAYNKELKNIKNKRKKYLNKIYKNRISLIKRLNKKKDKNNIEKKLKFWQKKGYDTSVFERKINSISINDIKRKLKVWQKKGYNTEVLNKKF